MRFEENETLKALGNRFGYLFSYFLFTTILFLILGILNKIPDTWGYPHVMGITALIVLIGWTIKRMLR